MPKDGFKLYKSFKNIEDAKEFSTFLIENNVENSLETIGNVFDTSISGKASISNYLIKIESRNFEKVNKLLSDSVKNLSKEELEAHHLNLLDNKELELIFIKPDEWATEDVEIARQLLTKRGFKIDENKVKRLKNKRFEEIRKGKKGSLFFLTLTFLAIILGLFTFLAIPPGGLGMAYYYAYGSSTDSTGFKYFTYDESTRKKGKVILFLGSSILILEVVLLFILMNYTIGDINFYNWEY